MTPSSLAHTTATSATGALVIHIFLPVSRYPDEFYAYVSRNTKLIPGQDSDSKLFSAYPGKSALDLLYLGIAVAAVAVALIAFGHFGEKE